MPGRGEFAPTGFGPKLREAREGKGWTQQKLADAAGTHVNTIARLERDEQEPSWPLVLALAKALGVDCTVFAGDVAAKPEPDAESAEKSAKGKGKK